MGINVSQYKDLYLQTAQKLIAEYTICLSSLKLDQTILDLMRIFHSLKGQSMAMGYKKIAFLSLQGELVCKALSENKMQISEEIEKALPSPKLLLKGLESIANTGIELSFTSETTVLEALANKLKQKQLQLLLVEDDIFFQKICIDKLREKSIVVDFSDNGEDAIARMAAKKYDCVLLDIIMPKKNGFDVLAYAKENNIIPSTPIIVFSTLGQEDNIKKALSMGAVDFINKGAFDFDLLMVKIEAAISKKKAE